MEEQMRPNTVQIQFATHQYKSCCAGCARWATPGGWLAGEVWDKGFQNHEVSLGAFYKMGSHESVVGKCW